MRFASLDHFGLSAWRLACVGLASASAAWLLSGAAFGGILGQAEPAALMMVSAAVFYLVVTVPRRAVERQRVEAARESVLLSASARACLGVTGSRPRTLMMLEPREPSVAMAVKRAARLVLLGAKAGDALASASADLSSYSAASALRSLATLTPEGIEGGDEESRGLAASEDLGRETRVPIFMTACFFAPIMLLLYAVFSRSFDAASMTELATLEFVVVDVAYYLTSARGGPR
ncbi:MAG: hypothetical protein KGI26_05045 [Thaumarchaeota archaeon]|nr:hypothetical protein [Nitrososphaerota archaeon]